jgi:SPP1 family predicted phage head-tail adaptor
MATGVRGSGSRDRRVTIQRVTQVASESGFPKDSVESSFTVFASREDITGVERFEAQQLSARADTRWQLPYRPDMDPELVDVPKARRLVYRGRTYDIVAASVLGTKTAIELVTLAKVG